MSDSLRTLCASVAFIGCIALGGPGCSTAHSASPAGGAQPDVPLILTAGEVRPENDGLLAGYASGRVCRLRHNGSRTRVTWEATLGAPVSCLLEVPAPRDTTALLVGTSAGNVVRFDGRRTEPTWRFGCTCEVASFAVMPDLNGDGEHEILVGGADHRVHLLNGRTGLPVWSRLFESQEGDAYVVKVLALGEPDGGGPPDVAAWMWGGELAVLTGSTGQVRWRRRISTGFSDAIVACQDLNNDGIADFLAGGNDGTIRGCSGRDGEILWTGKLQKPIRDLVQPAAGDDANGRPVYACTAGGEVARFDLSSPSDTAPRWSVQLGDVCRMIRLVPDADADGSPDVAACAENGVVAVLSSGTGRFIRRQELNDTVRSICPLVADGRPCLAAASLDGTIAAVPLAPDADLRPSAGTPARQQMAAQAARPQPAGRIAAAAAEPRVIILLYHDVVPELFYHYGVSVETFRAHLDMLRDERYVCVSLDQIADWIEGKGPMPERAACVTFDGPYQGHRLYADPILRERGWFATSYITTDWIGSVNHADWHQLREMDAAGVMDIQNHSMNHPYLTRCTAEQIRDQLTGCNLAIARHMDGKVVRHHAYPAGAENAQVREVLRDMGFRTATTVVRRAVRKDDDLLGLPRYMVCTHTTPEQFRDWLTGAEPTAAPR